MRLANLKIQRIKKGITQMVLGKRIGVSERMISGYETGRNVPDSYTTTKLAEALECSQDDLMHEPI